ncbi:MAG: leucyl/phenylalanyl-tRNA--protein transferase [Rhodospirillales bacterium]|nr:leucyl/phenylalanyl-tRNA--protein transferase [Rhodospirillales bacterium]
MSRRDRGNHGLTPELLIRAYAAGIFPMAERRDDSSIFWVDPRVRGVMPLERIHVPRRLMRSVRRKAFQVRCDAAFAKVLRACAAPKRHRRDTWINRPIEEAVIGLHEMGFAHSVEAWRDGRLVGGLYGVALGGAFFGESMFSSERDASKVALVHLVARLRLGGFKLLDVQFITDHLRQFGAVEIPARLYLERLEAALTHQGVFRAVPEPAELEDTLEELFRASRDKG